jgi:ATP-dependent Lon protease
LGLDLPLKALNGPWSSASGAPGTVPDESLATQAFREVLKQLAKLDDPEQLADLVSATLLPEPTDRQLILETSSLDERLRYLVRFLLGEISRQKSQLHE